MQRQLLSAVLRPTSHSPLGSKRTRAQQRGFAREANVAAAGSRRGDGVEMACLPTTFKFGIEGRCAACIKDALARQEGWGCGWRRCATRGERAERGQRGRMAIWQSGMINGLGWRRMGREDSHVVDDEGGLVLVVSLPSLHTPLFSLALLSFRTLSAAPLFHTSRSRRRCLSSVRLCSLVVLSWGGPPP
ncbi:hypothetical protein BKA80DRAFT_61921 [Phyllosticta citrichinensis]